VTIHVVRTLPGVDHEATIDRAFEWFEEIEERCTRFDPNSELMQLTAQTGRPVKASTLLYEAVRFALSVAEETEGVFDPTVGHRMAERGFDREHRSGQPRVGAIDAPHDVSWRDVTLDPVRQTITLRRPLALDLGSVAKGLAIDTAARVLAPLRDFSIDAGGDLYMGGNNAEGRPWVVGIRHPRQDGQLIAKLAVSDLAVCTSGDYEKPDHILNARHAMPARALASVTVVAPGAMLADALATAVFAMGPEQGLRLLENVGVAGLLITPELERFETGDLSHVA
jgi:thiamine biosynthesis lipoprotein